MASNNLKELQQFILADVTSTGKALGEGSYGVVEEVEVHRDGVTTICAAKKLHSILTDVLNDGADVQFKNFLKECHLMSNLKHDNITEFIGIWYTSTSKLPHLVIERMEMSLREHFIEKKKLSFTEIKSILVDVARGLEYLHGRQPPVIHRDLSNNNVLLKYSPKLIAKISDLGNFTKLMPSQSKMTKCPGTQDYMPPEALDDRQCYGPSLDIFSFGHLALCTIVQQPHLDILSPKQDLQAISEVERRTKHIKIMETIILYHPLNQLVKQCLDDLPRERPSAKMLLNKLTKKMSLLMISDPVRQYYGRYSSVCLHPTKDFAVCVSEQEITGGKLFYSLYSVNKESPSKALTPATEYDNEKLHPSVALVDIDDVTYTISTAQCKDSSTTFHYRIGVVSKDRKKIKWQLDKHNSKGEKPRISANCNGVIAVVYEHNTKIRWMIGQMQDVSSKEELKITWKDECSTCELVGVEPAVAINNTHIAVICRTGLRTLQYIVGTIQPNYSIEWGPITVLPSTGICPAISINSRGYVVEMHQTFAFRKLELNYGKIVSHSRMISWQEDASIYYTSGEYPTLSLNDYNFFLEMHKTNFGVTLFQSQGKLETNEDIIEAVDHCGPSVDGDSAHHYDPSDCNESGSDNKPRNAYLF